MGFFDFLHSIFSRDSTAENSPSNNSNNNILGGRPSVAPQPKSEPALPAPPSSFQLPQTGYYPPYLNNCFRPANIFNHPTRLALYKSAFVAFDTETTGLNPYVDRIIQISAVKFENLIPTATFSTYVDPGRPIPVQATRINGITDGNVRGAPNAFVALKSFYAFVDDLPLAAHNAKFDTDFIKCEAERFGAETTGQLLVSDTLSISRYLFPDLVNHKLITVANKVRSPVMPSHNALSDAKACGYVMCFAINVARPETRAVRPLRVTSNSSSSTFNFFNLSSGEKEAFLVDCMRLIKDTLDNSGLDCSKLSYFLDTTHYANFYYYNRLLLTIKTGRSVYALVSPKFVEENHLDNVADCTATEGYDSKRFFLSSSADIRLLADFVLEKAKWIDSHTENYIKESYALNRWQKSFDDLDFNL